MKNSKNKKTAKNLTLSKYETKALIVGRCDTADAMFDCSSNLHLVLRDSEIAIMLRVYVHKIVNCPKYTNKTN